LNSSTRNSKDPNNPRRLFIEGIDRTTAFF